MTRQCSAPGCTFHLTGSKEGLRRNPIDKSDPGRYCARHAKQFRTHGRLTPELERATPQRKDTPPMPSDAPVPQPHPVPTPDAPAPTDKRSVDLAAIRDILNGMGLEARDPRVDALQEQIAQLEAEGTRQTHRFEVPNLPPSDFPEGMVPHPIMDKALNRLQSIGKVYLYGPSGSGKTTLAEQAAEVLKCKLFWYGQVFDSFDFKGYHKPHDGSFLKTPLRQWAEEIEAGGRALLCLDDADGSLPQAMVWIQAMLATGVLPFEDRAIKLPGFGHRQDSEGFAAVIMTANTIGQGADRDYVARVKQDKAFLARFAFLRHDYDRALEEKLAGSSDEGKAWLRRVWALREATHKAGVGVILGTRVVTEGLKMIQWGATMDETVEEIVYQGGVDQATQDKIRSYMVEA